MITNEDVSALTLERDSLKSQLSERDAEIHALRLELRTLLKTVNTISAQNPPRRSAEVSSRSEVTYLNIIGGLLKLLLGQSPSGEPYSRFRTQDSVIAAMIAQFGANMGFSDRTLRGKFAEARRKLGGGG